jgi:trk system potassium uptake protein TrkH|tara:strand:- start:2153 stop:3007 length:855 start_codon:yes stop_codon:yes gene_type:complete
MGYLLAGMSLFDAICHSFSTVAIGGFSTHDASLGYFNSPTIEAVAIVFMLLSSINFALHFFGFRDRSLKAYWRDEEVRALLVIMSLSVLLVAGVLISSGLGTTASVRASLFQVVSMFTTTGFATASFVDWPGIAPFVLIFGAFVGACAGSTGGGLKVIRVLLIYKQGLREIYRLIHPQAVFPIKLGQRVMTEGVIQAVWGFLSIYVFVFIILLMILLSTQLDFETSFSAVASAMNNLGPGLGAVSAHYGGISDTAKIALSVGMVLGRLEIFTVLVLFTGMFWRK